MHANLHSNYLSSACRTEARTCKHALSQSILHAYCDIALQARCHFLCCLHCSEERATVYLAYVLALLTEASVSICHNTVRRVQVLCSSSTAPAASHPIRVLVECPAASEADHQQPGRNRLLNTSMSQSELSTRTHLCLSQPMLIRQVRSFTVPGNKHFAARC